MARPESAAAVAPSSGAKRLRRGRTAAPALPNDVVAEILARLPVRSVLRCAPVSKAWHAMVSSPSFVRRHMELSKTRPCAVILPSPLPATGGAAACPGDEEEDATGRMVFYHLRASSAAAAELIFEHAIRPKQLFGPPSHCDGLLAFYSSGYLYVCNPATRELMALPPCRFFMTESVGLCCDARSGAYKVFHAYADCLHGVGVEALTLGAADPSWRELSDFPAGCPIVVGSVVSVGGAIYWQMSDDASALSDILCLDASTEQFTLVPPPRAEGPTRAAAIKEVQGKLCLFRFFHASRKNKSRLMPPMTMEMWFMTGNPESPAWTRSRRFDNTSIHVSLHSPVLIWESGRLLVPQNHCLCFYNALSGELEDVLEYSDLSYFNPETKESDERIHEARTLRVSAYAESLVAITPKQRHA